jgi:hypothetical protein
VVAKAAEKLSVSKRATQMSDMGRSNLKKLNVTEGKAQNWVNISNSIDNVDIDRACEIVNISQYQLVLSLGYYEQEQHRPWFGCNLHNGICKVSTGFRINTRECPNDQINKLCNKQ